MNKKTETTENETTVDNESVIESEENVPLTFDDKLTAFIDRTNFEQLVPVMYVYKFVGNSQTNRELCGKFEGNDIPDEHNIGLNYGSGCYMAAVNVPPGQKQARRQCSFTFKISTYYDDLRRQAIHSGTLPSLYSLPVRGNVQQPPAAPAVDSMQMFREGMMFVTDMLQKMQPPAPVNNPDMSALMLNQYKGMGEILKQNLLQTDAFMQSALKNRMENGSGGEGGNEEYEGEDKEPETENLLQKLLPEFIKMLPALLSSPKTAAIVQAVTSPAAAQVASTAVKAAANARETAIDREISRRKQATVPPIRKIRKKTVASTIPEVEPSAEA